MLENLNNIKVINSLNILLSIEFPSEFAFVIRCRSKDSETAEI